MNDYEIKRQTKIERCKALSGKHSVQADQDFDHAHLIISTSLLSPLFKGILLTSYKFYIPFLSSLL